MEKEEIEKSLLEELGTILARDLGEEDADKPLRDLGVDSLSMVELFVTIEKRLGIRLMEAGLTRENFTSIDTLSSAISGIQK